MKESFTDGAYRTFVADVPADLLGKEGSVVQLKANGKIELLGVGGLAMGTLHQNLEGDDGAWTVRLLGKGGTVRLIQDGAVAPGGRVKGKTGGRVEALGVSGRSLGIKLSPDGNGAAGDVIEVLDVIEVIA